MISFLVKILPNLLDIEWELCKKGVARFCHRMRKTTTNLLNLVLNRIITEPFRFHSFFFVLLYVVLIVQQDMEKVGVHVSGAE